MKYFILKRVSQCTIFLMMVLAFSFGTLRAEPLLDLSSVSGCATVTIPITLTNEQGTDVVGTSNDIAYDPDYFDFLDCTIGPAGEAANKGVQFSLPSYGVLRVGVLEMNLDPIPDGVVASVTFYVEDDAPCDDAYILMNAPTATDAVGNLLDLTGTDGEIYVLCDADYDDVCDCDDNCPDTSNGSFIGTCTCGNEGEPCMNDTDCGDCGFCSMNQEDTDGDGLGDVCDDSPYADLCQSYCNLCECCVDLKVAGREVDYNVCKDLSSQGQGVCETAGCTWYLNSPNQVYPCMLDICLLEVTGDDYIGVMDFAIFKREQGRGSCQTIEADDLCQMYYEKHLFCLDKQSAGREVDYNVCKDLSSQGQTVCEAAGCTWYLNSPNQVYPCMLDLCLSEVTGDDYIGVMDFVIFKREQGRGSCPCSP